LDRALYFGDGVYEVLRSYNGKISAIDDHFTRFNNSLDAIGIVGVEIDKIKQIVLHAFDQADIPNARIYFHITRGSAPRSHTWSKDIKPNFFMTITHLPDDTKSKKNGVSVSSFPDWRWKRCDIKSLNLLANILARQDAEKKGCDEAILVDDQGLITEGAGSSFLAIFSDTLQTAPLTANVLPSITRKYIIKAAEEIGMNIIEESMTPDKARSADELLLAVTTKDIIPVIKFDDVEIGNAKPGCYTKKIMDQFKELVQNM
jgi:D-alanine transaminase